MRNEQRIRPFELALLLSLCLSLCHGTVASAQQTRLERSVVRLHVIAESDEAGEQALKERVRDRVLSVLSPALADADSPESAEARILGCLGDVRSAAESAAEGRSVSVEYGTAAYPTRIAEGCVLPAGEYKSLRVTIGAGAGHNWWGVIFPYFTELTTENAEQVSRLLGERNFALITDGSGITIRLRILELLRELRGK